MLVNKESELDIRFWYDQKGFPFAEIFGEIGDNRFLKLTIHEHSFRWKVVATNSPAMYSDEDFDFDSEAWLGQIFRHEFRYSVSKGAIIAVSVIFQ